MQLIQLGNNEVLLFIATLKLGKFWYTSKSPSFGVIFLVTFFFFLISASILSLWELHALYKP